jgi:hypothetical protein
VILLANVVAAQFGSAKAEQGANGCFHVGLLARDRKLVTATNAKFHCGRNDARKQGQLIAEEVAPIT